MKSLPPRPSMMSSPPRPRMQSTPEVPNSTSVVDVPRILLLPAGQQDASSLSVVVTSCVALVRFPSLSTACHVTVVTPSGNTVGASLLMLTVKPQELLKVGVPNATPVQVLTSRF